MPGRPSTHPKVSWNSITNRWEVTSKAGRLEMAVDRQCRIPVRTISFIGSMPIVNGAGSYAVGTIDNATGLRVGDMVFVTRGSISTLAGIFSPCVPTNDVLNVLVSGSMPAGGYNVFAIRTATG